jgi:signal transduction histidine kinase
MGLMIMGLMNGAADRAGAYPVLTQVASYAGELARPPVPRQHSREVCHDMRQPVAGVLSLAAAALTVPGLPSAARSWLEQIVTQAEALAELIDQSLDREDPVSGTLRTDLGQLSRAVVTGEQLTYRGMLHARVPSRPVLVDYGRGPDGGVRATVSLPLGPD